MGKYDDIINLPHHVSPNRSHISKDDRAAQFAPFAALTGFDAQIEEEGRWVEQKIESDENQTAIINGRLVEIMSKLPEKPVVTAEYFLPDSEKAGGEYKQITDNAVKIDTAAGKIIFENGTEIPFENIVSLY